MPNWQFRVSKCQNDKKLSKGKVPFDSFFAM